MINLKNDLYSQAGAGVKKSAAAVD